MNRTELNVNGKRITLWGSKTIIEKEQPIIENLKLTGNENNDRLLIQRCIDENKLKSDILYDGNTVYPFEKIVKAYRKLQKSGSLENLTNEMYHFFMYACGDIAHYDLGGFKAYYNYSFIQLENTLLKDNWLMNTRFSDVNHIFKELKIGKYFEERDYINIDNVSLNKLKSIIKNCGWNITQENNSWELEKDIIHSQKYSFKVDVSSKSVSNIVSQIMALSYNFNKNEYMEYLIKNRDESENKLNVADVVTVANNIGSSLSNLADKVLYDCRLEVEENKTDNTQNINLQQDDYDYDMCG